MANLRISDLALRRRPDEEKGDLAKSGSKSASIYTGLREGQATDSMSGGQIQHSHYDEKGAGNPTNRV
jgi:hypothetical protein